MPLDIDRPPDGSHDMFRTLDFGGVLVSVLTGPTRSVYPASLPVCRDDPAAVRVFFPVCGRFLLSTRDRNLMLGPSELIVCGSAERFESRTDNGRDDAASIVVQTPRARLRLHAYHVEQLMGKPLPSDRGVGAVLRAYVVGLLDRLGDCRPADAARLASITVDLLRAVFAHHVDAQRSMSPQAAQQELRARIDIFIKHNLADPDLSPDLIATEHRISLRYLYKLFQDEEQSVAATIRRLRLEGCRVDLAAPEMRMLSIRSVSARWGFIEAAQFSRAFRLAYGMSPSEFRNLTMATGAQDVH